MGGIDSAFAGMMSPNNLTPFIGPLAGATALLVLLSVTIRAVRALARSDAANETAAE